MMTILAPNAPWPTFSDYVPRQAKKKSGRKPSVAPQIIEHLKKHLVSGPTLMVASGIACSHSILCRTLNEMENAGTVEQVHDWPKHNPQAKYYRLKEGESAMGVMQ